MTQEAQADCHRPKRILHQSAQMLDSLDSGKVSTPSVAVIGAGGAGLAAGRLLRDAGQMRHNNVVSVSGLWCLSVDIG